LIVRSHFSDEEAINCFIERIRVDKPRYIRDQMILMWMVCEHPQLGDYAKKALDYCLEEWF